MSANLSARVTPDAATSERPSAPVRSVAPSSVPARSDAADSCQRGVVPANVGKHDDHDEEAGYGHGV